jgi:phosphomannomutase
MAFRKILRLDALIKFLYSIARGVVSDVKLDKPLNIVIDAGNGIAGNIAPKLFERLGAKVTKLFCIILKPLYSGGLCEPVIITPEVAALL